MNQKKVTPLYEVISPWAEADPVPPRGLTVERPTDLNGKTIGLFHIWKRASKPILEVMERELKKRFPAARFSWYTESRMNTPEIESDNIAKYEAWLKGLDTVLFAYGD
ncbi:MAG: hypothetical protein A2Y89_03020 [Chloroflexi bacterium RBG_13_51_18]|nr:MAG: hypothetical protein A2Y89_03020 [Chloroflexi bacterium RBG_13_51_18]